MVSFRVSISPKTVGAYRIRPDVSEKEKTAVSILSLKACRAARQGFPAWENVPHEPGKVSPPGEMSLGNGARFSCLGKCSSETERGFPARENVPLEPSKLFPPGEMFLGNRARFSHPGKCSSETEQGFPAWGNVPRKPGKLFPPWEMFLGNRARFSY